MISIRVVKTDDGSHTLFSEQFNAHYHSLKGALQESQHIFIDNGYNHINRNEVHILEIGLGTGLNATLTATNAVSTKRTTHYTGIELYPPPLSILSQLNYGSILSPESIKNWEKITNSEWNTENQINDFFTLKKIQDDFTHSELDCLYDLVYFDAFAPDDQPEMWSEANFEKLFKHTKLGGILLTYCSKGIVKKALRKAGFKVERLAGPAGKRHILRATHV